MWKNIQMIENPISNGQRKCLPVYKLPSPRPMLETCLLHHPSLNAQQHILISFRLSLSHLIKNGCPILDQIIRWWLVAIATPLPHSFNAALVQPLVIGIHDGALVCWQFLCQAPDSGLRELPRTSCPRKGILRRQQGFRRRRRRGRARGQQALPVTWIIHGVRGRPPTGGDLLQASSWE